ncbi:hypothetical protein SAMN02745119_00782 [Trichlorobacter thiogenes]|uniref:Uncharacterized protein n=1 Tax=Trichlorobacter thiogenes TaxID=115783 RepID=A0A1T4L5K5_9BACT|nr:hypothetical protein [Trichlorobacter thiogenes]SJZ50022.1 hypothetical protein SAMN02745119_00782 [Trichlorobacter thiogenes]
MQKIKILFLVLSVLLLSAFSLQAAEQPAFVGRYYLQGVREVGSELLLRTNGSYAWMLAYGNQDHSSEGRWTRQGDSIVLTAAVPSTTGPLFQLDTKKPTEPWNFEAEKALQEQLYAGQREAVLKACPFLDTAEYASAPKMIGVPESSKAERQQQADAALLKLHKATKAVELAAANAVKHNSQTAMQKAVEAMDRFQEAWLTAKETNGDAGRPALKRPVLHWPKSCQMPQEPDVQQDRPASWSRQGVGVVVRDSSSGSPLYRLKIGFVLADGARRAAVSSGAVAVVRLGAQEKVIALELKAGPGQLETLTLPPGTVSGSIYQLLVDASRLVQPFFRELRLEIEGNALVWPETGGRYQR